MRLVQDGDGWPSRWAVGIGHLLRRPFGKYRIQSGPECLCAHRQRGRLALTTGRQAWATNSKGSVVAHHRHVQSRSWAAGAPTTLILFTAVGILGVAFRSGSERSEAGSGVFTQSNLFQSDSAVPAPDWPGFGMFAGVPRLRTGGNPVRVPPRAQCFPWNAGFLL